MKYHKLKYKALTFSQVLAFSLLFATPVFASEASQHEIQPDENTAVASFEGPNTLIIELGAEWADTEFTFTSENSAEPAAAVVSPEGVLTLSLDGSYIYRLESGGSDLPQTEKAADSSVIIEETEEDAADPIPEQQSEDAGEEGSTILPGVPNQHLFLFGGGLIVCIGALIAMHVIKKRRTNADYDAEDDDDYDDY